MDERDCSQMEGVEMAACRNREARARSTHEKVHNTGARTKFVYGTRE